VSLSVTPTILGEGESFIDMRRRNLMFVRDNLSAQLCDDQFALRTLLSEPDQSPT
jgi:hypothetical protein